MDSVQVNRSNRTCHYRSIGFLTNLELKGCGVLAAVYLVKQNTSRKTVNINLILFGSSKASDRNLNESLRLERNPTKLARAGGTSGYSREKRGRIERVLKVNAKDLG